MKQFAIIMKKETKINNIYMDNELLKNKYFELKKKYLVLKELNQQLEEQIKVFKMYYELDAEKMDKQKKEIIKLQETIMSLLFE